MATIVRPDIQPVPELFGQPTVVLRIPSPPAITTEDFYQLICLNRDLPLEKNSDNSVTILHRHGANDSSRNADISCQLRQWSKTTGIGKAFGSGTPFCLKNGAVRRPDASLMSLADWNSISKDEREKISPHSPVFVIELRSFRDRLIDIQNKLTEYLNNNILLAWLIDAHSKTIQIYRPGQPVEILDNPATVSGETVLPGFELDLNEIFTA